MQYTGAGASSQNGSCERPHQAIGNVVWAMLYSAGFLPNYWEYLFYFFIRIYAVLPHGNNTTYRHHKAVGRPTDLLRLHAFGCCTYALFAKCHDGKLTIESVAEGRLLGYGGSMKTFIYENIHTRRLSSLPLRPTYL
jgi:hypothetical protein